jgi:hypothetical protein
MVSETILVVDALKYTQGYGLQTPAVQSLSAEQAK